MGLDDFAPIGIKTVAKRALAPEDEDLFDFPVIEMTYEGDKANERHTVASVGTVPAPTASAPAAHAAPAPSAPAQAAAKSESAPAKSATPKSAAPLAAPAKAQKTARASAAPKAAASSAHSDVQPAADLIDQLEEVLDDRRALERAPRRRTTGARFALPLGAPRVLLGGMLMLNVLTFAFFWMVSQSFRSGIESLRDDLVLATRSAPLVSAQPSVQAAPVTHEPAPVEPVAQSTHTEPAHATPPAPATPLDAFEQTTLALAAKEIDGGEFMNARKRLNRLLALADRIDATLKADIEARARFLIAESYRAQGAAKAAHLEEVVHANEAAARTSAPVQVPPKAEGH